MTGSDEDSVADALAETSALMAAESSLVVVYPPDGDFSAVNDIPQRLPGSAIDVQVDFDQFLRINVWSEGNCTAEFSSHDESDVRDYYGLGDEEWAAMSDLVNDMFGEVPGGPPGTEGDHGQPVPFPDVLLALFPDADPSGVESAVAGDRTSATGLLQGIGRAVGLPEWPIGWTFESLMRPADRTQHFVGPALRELPSGRTLDESGGLEA